MKRHTLVWLGACAISVAAGFALWQFVAAHNSRPAVAQAVTSDIRAASHRTANAVPLEGEPVRLVIPGLAIDLAIIPQNFDQTINSWQVSEQAANFMNESPLPNNRRGTSFIYGHDRKEVLAKTSYLRPGDLLSIYTANDHVFTYSYISSQTVKPEDAGVLENLSESEPGLKLMTCQGLWSQDRRIMSFKLVSAS